MSDGEENIVHAGRFLTYRQTESGWEYVTRTKVKGCVAVLAMTEDKRVILTEQFRPPVERKVIELPAGLAGDIPLQRDEPLEVAAKRELKEETGYEAQNWTVLTEGTSSAGMTDELVTIFYATGLTKVTDGGGVGGEDIKVHYVHQLDVPQWCADRQRQGVLVDFKIFAALYLARSLTQESGPKLWY